MNIIKKLNTFLLISLMSQILCSQTAQATPNGPRQSNNRRTNQSGDRTTSKGGNRRTNVSNNRNNRSDNRNNRTNNRTNRNPEIIKNGVINPNAKKAAGLATLQNNNQTQEAITAWLAYCSQNSSTDSRCNNYNDTNQQTTQQPSQTPVIIVQ